MSLLYDRTRPLSASNAGLQILLNQESKLTPQAGGGPPSWPTCWASLCTELHLYQEVPGPEGIKRSLAMENRAERVAVAMLTLGGGGGGLLVLDLMTGPCSV